MRNGIMSSRFALGGTSDKPAATRGTQYTPRDLKSLRRQLLFPRGDFSQTMLDIAKIVGAALLVTATGIGLAGALFILLFVQT